MSTRPAPSVASCASTSVPLLASARPSPCSTKAGDARSAAPTSSSASWRRTGDPRRSRSCATWRWCRGAASTTGGRPSRRWTSTRSWPADPQVALIDELAHTNVPGSAQREAVAGRRRAARRRHRRHHHREHPAPREPERRHRADHGHPAARDRPRRGRAPRRPDRARRHEPRGAPAAHGPRQHLPARARRRRAGQLLPARQPGRPPGAGAAVGRRPGRRGPPRLHGGPRHRRGVGDARACRRRRDRCAGR